MFNLKFYTMKQFLKILQAGWVLALTLATAHIYFDLIPLKLWYFQVLVLLAVGVLLTLWITMVVKILNTAKADTNHESKVLNIPRVSDYVCPKCGNANIADWVYDNELLCPKCDHRWAN